MTPTDWDVLTFCWRSCPKEWQYRLAEILSEADSQYSIALFFKIIKMTDDELAQEAINSLHAIDSGKLPPKIERNVIKRLKVLTQKRPRFDRKIINELLGRLEE